MKGLILSLPVRNKKSITVKKEYKEDFRRDLRRYIPFIMLILSFTAGVVLGALAFKTEDKKFLNGMDFLFAANLKSGENLSFAGSFAAFFSSDFLFLSAVILLGLSPWGCGVIPFVYGFKGFGTGFMGAYLISSMGLKGFGFYVTVILPGAFMFSLCLLFFSVKAMGLSFRLGSALFFAKTGESALSAFVRRFLKISGKYLVLTALCAVCDVFFRCFVAEIWF